MWLTTHVRNPEDLTGLICPSKRSSRLGLSIPSSIVGPSERLANLVCPFCLALWKKENFSLLVPNEAYLGPDGVILDGLYVYPGRPKGLESRKDMWREAPPQYPLICLPLSDKVAIGLRQDELSVFKFLSAKGCVPLRHGFRTLLRILLLLVFSICRTTQLLI